VVGRPAFGFENFGDSRFVVGVCCQTIHCFGGQTQQLTCTQSVSRLLHMGGFVARNDHVQLLEKQGSNNLKSVDAQNGSSL
jgi:hypothetical protein